MMYYSVDALENGTARLIDDEGAQLEIPAAMLPAGTAETDVVELRSGIWAAAPQEAERRRQHAAELLKKILNP